MLLVLQNNNLLEPSGDLITVPYGFLRAYSVRGLSLTGCTPTAIVTVSSPTIPVDEGTLALSGKAPTLLDFGFPVTEETLALTGQAPGLTWEVSQPAGALTINGQAPSLDYTIVDPAIDDLNFTGYAPTFSWQVSQPKGSLTIDGKAPSTDYGIAVPAGALTLNEKTPTIERDFFPTVGEETLTLTGYAPTVTIGLLVPEGTLTISGKVVTFNWEISQPDGALTLTGYIPGVLSGNQFSPPTGSLDIDGYAPTFNWQISQPEGSLTLAGQAPSVDTGIAVPAGSLTLTGEAGPTFSWIIQTESDRENIIWPSNDFTHARYTKQTNVTLGSLVSDPDGGTNAQRIDWTLATDGLGIYIIPITGRSVALQQYTRSLWLRADTPGNGEIRITDPVNSANWEDVVIDSTWQRYDVTFDVPVNATSGTGMWLRKRPGGPDVFDTYEWQQERSAYVSPLLPTTTQAETASLIGLNGQAPSVDTGIAVPAGALTLEGQAPSVERDFFIDVAAGSLALTGYIPEIGSADKRIPPAGSLTLAGQAPSAEIDYFIDVPLAQEETNYVETSDMAVWSPNTTLNTNTASGLYVPGVSGGHEARKNEDNNDSSGGQELYLLTTLINTLDSPEHARLFSLFAKAGTHDQLALRMAFIGADTTTDAFFDLTNGTAGTVKGPTGVESGIIAYPDGWYRCWVNSNSATVDTNYQLRATMAEADNVLTIITRDGKNIYVANAMLEDKPTGTLPSTFIPNLTAGSKSASVHLTGKLPSLDHGIAVPAGSLTIAGQAPTVVAATSEAPPAGSLSLTGQAPTLVTTGAISRTPAAGALVLAGDAPLYGFGELPSAAALAFTGNTFTLRLTFDSYLSSRRKLVRITARRRIKHLFRR
jgi:hypothetical protein